VDPFPDFEDPEENNWVLPKDPSPASVPNNTSSWGPIYFWRGLANPRQLPLSVALTREITSPWRRGLGLVVRARHQRAFALGLWRRGLAPSILSKSPREQDWQDVAKRAEKLKTT
jgi:hypothetical protein